MESRRGLIQKTLGGALLLGAAGLVPVALRGTRVSLRPGAVLRFFTPAEASIFAAIAARVLAEAVPAALGAERPGGAATVPEPVASAIAALPRAPSPAELDLVGKADAFFAPFDAEAAGEVKQLLALFDSALFSLLGGGPPAPFTAQSPEQQDRQLARWANSRVAVMRSGYQALKRISCALYFGAPELAASLGYPGPPIELVESVNRARANRPPSPPGSTGSSR